MSQHDVFISSIVNDGIGEVLYRLRKDLTGTKSTKSNSLHSCFYAYKKHKVLNKRFSSLHTRCFYAHKKHKKHKALYKRLYKHT